MAVVVDTSKLTKALKAFVGTTRLEAAKEMRIQARVLAMRLMQNTQPSPLIGRGKKSNDELLKQSEKKVSGQIGRVYKLPPLVAWWIANMNLPQGKTRTQNAAQAARAFLSLMRGKAKKAAVVEAQQILNRINRAPLVGSQIGQFDGGDAHKRARFGPRQNVPKNQYVRQVVTNEPALKKYIKMRQERIGTAKAGWAACAERLGGAKAVRSKDDGRVEMPKWVKRLIGRYQSGAVQDNSDSERKPFIELRNTVKYIGNLISPRTIQDTVNSQVLRMINRLSIIAAAEAKKAGFR